MLPPPLKHEFPRLLLMRRLFASGSSPILLRDVEPRPHHRLSLLFRVLLVPPTPPSHPPRPVRFLIAVALEAAGVGRGDGVAARGMTLLFAADVGDDDDDDDFRDIVREFRCVNSLNGFAVKSDRLFC